MSRQNVRNNTGNITQRMTPGKPLSFQGPQRSGTATRGSTGHLVAITGPPNRPQPPLAQHPCSLSAS